MSAELDLRDHPSADEIEREALAICGLPSYIERGADGDEQQIGHVLLVDYDDADPLKARDELRRLPGIGMIFESSPGSYHGAVLSVDDLDSQLLRALQLHGDPQHVAIAARREFAVIRVTPKWYVRDLDSDDQTEIDAPAPEPLFTWATPIDSSGDLPAQSRPHFDAFAKLLDDETRDDLADSVDQWVHGRVPLLAYQDVSSDLKADLWG